VSERNPDTIAAPARPALILVPGLLCDAAIWQHQQAALGATHETGVPVLDSFASIPAMANALLAAAPDRFALAGHSFGARIALEVLRQAPARVERLALLDTGVHPCAAGEPERRMALVTLGESSGMRAVARAWLPPMLHMDARTNIALVATLEAMVERSTPQRFRNQQQALIARPDARAVLRLVRCPMLVLCGREDAWSPLSQHEAIAGAIAHARLVVIERCGHMAPVERPDEVTAALRAWLDE
jgi:pimeloyl-ACP methyl ester carboxylesterase